MPPRRSILALLAAFPALMASSTTAKHKKHKKKRKPVPPSPPSPPDSPPPPPPPPAQCTAFKPVVCGPYCCYPEDSVCCDDALDINGKQCYPTDSLCCPINLGGGACKLNLTCCPAQKGGVVATCANISLGQFCCPPDSGGFCDVDQWCCPSAVTNSHNLGCCQFPQSCCNSDIDCISGVGGPVCDHFTGCCRNR